MALQLKYAVSLNVQDGYALCIDLRFPKAVALKAEFKHPPAKILISNHVAVVDWRT